jgi:hypothetical protein
MFISLWKLYEKAGRKGWEGIVPFYNLWVMAEIVGKPGWLGLVAILSFIIPFLGWIIGLVIIAYLYYLLAKSFGQSPLFALGLLFLGFIFFPILAFGDAKYLGPPEDDLNLIDKK